MVLHIALESALKSGLIARNPADAVSPPRIQRAEMRVWNEDDMHYFLDATRSYPFYLISYLALFTGMRRAELLALRWCDVDLLYGKISISRSLHHLKDGSLIIRRPKTANRTVALPPSATLVLKEHREKQLAERVLIGKLPTDDDLVFCHPDGKPILPDTVTHTWTKLVRRFGLKEIRFHDTRHTRASLMLKQGVHPKVVQERLGHSSIQVTLDTYSHVAPGLQEAAANRFDETIALNRKTKPSVKIG